MQPLFAAVLLIGLTSCDGSQEQAADSAVAQDFSSYVNPMIGTDGIVHTFPGATVPFGKLQLSPDGGTNGWNWCSGYHYSDANIMGFSHTHLSGTGWSDLGDILVMPTVGELQLLPGSKEEPDTGYRSRIDHEREDATPGYYQVELLDYDVNAELTVGEQVAYHKYTFPESKEAHIVIDPDHIIFGRVQDTQVEIVDANTVKGFCHSIGWGGDRYVYFTLTTSKAFKTAGVSLGEEVQKDAQRAAGRDAKAFLNFETEEGEAVEVKVAISAVSQANADANHASAGDTQFDAAREAARAAWANEINKIQVKGGTEDQRHIFYTGLYHAMIHPSQSMDVNGQYVANGGVHQAEGYVNYSSFSLWDTFRAVHPLMTMLDTERTADFANALISRYENGSHLPMWELCGADNTCMIGYPAVSVIADAILKDIPGIDAEKAYAAMRDIAFFPKHSSSDGASGLEDYIKLGYIPSDVAKSVSKTLEYGYYDWCIAQIAKKLGKTEDVKLFEERAKNFMALYNPEKKMYWPKDRDGNWAELNMKSWESLQPHYVSGNIWAYNYFYPHATNLAIEQFGGMDAYLAEMDNMFAQVLDMEGEQHVDLTGFMGHYGHGDEPGHNILYIYNFLGQPWKAQEKIKEVQDNMYFNKPDGAPNNDDCGQMSAWYIYSSLGFYPVCPGDMNYIIGKPMFEEATINVAGGKQFVIKAPAVSETNCYVQGVKLNGEELAKSFITHSDIMNGGTLEFEMGSTPNKEWGAAMENRPVSALR